MLTFSPSSYISLLPSSVPSPARRVRLPRLRLWRSAAAAATISLFAAGLLGAQAEQQPTKSPPSAQPLPLSGRQQSGSVVPMETPSTGTGTNSVNTVTPSIEIQGAYQGSAPSGTAGSQPLSLSLSDAVERGIRFNLGEIGAGEASREARSERLAAAAQLLPDVIASAQASEQQINLPAMGFSFHIPIPGFTFPTIVRYSFMDVQANLTESFSVTGLRNWRASQESARSAELSVDDSRELVALAVAGTYLQLVATASRIQTVEAQVNTALALYQLALDQDRNGLGTQMNVNRSQVELQTDQERLTSLSNDFDKRKITLARLIGLPLAQPFTLANSVLQQQMPAPSLEDLIRRALANRADVQAAAAQVRAAEAERSAAGAEHLPSVDFAGDYGGAGVTFTNQFHDTFAATATVQVPIMRSGRIRADHEAADAALDQRKAEYADAKARAEADVRTAVLDLNTAMQQIRVTQSNRALAAQTLEQARDRFRSGVTNTVEVVQAQETVASAEQDYITALFALNLAQASLARAVGDPAEQMVRELQGP